jgi:hypothetical protein
MHEKLNPKIVEEWIIVTLEDAKYMSIPGVISKPSHKDPLARMGIDRIT